MFKPTVRLIAGYLGDANFGIVPTATRVLGADPTFDLPLRNSADHVGIMKDVMDPDVLPCYALWVDSSADAQSQGGLLTRNILLAGALLTSADADTGAATDLAELVMRSVLLSMDRYNSMQYSQAYRERDGVRILKRVQTVEEMAMSAKGPLHVWGYTGIHLLVVDTLSKAAS
jgi:hypothetical protein